MTNTFQRRVHGLLDYLTPEDVILADGGFDIQESIGVFVLLSRYQHSPRVKKQLSGIEVE